MIQASESAKFCSVCDDVTVHANGECVECAYDLHRERVAWMRTKRKAFVIVVSILSIFAIMWAMAQQFSGDDVARGVLASIVVGIGVWFGTSMKAESNVGEK